MNILLYLSLYFAICLINSLEGTIISSSEINMCTTENPQGNETEIECEKKLLVSLAVNNNEVC